MIHRYTATLHRVSTRPVQCRLRATNTVAQVVPLSAKASKITLTPQAPGSGTLSCLSRSASTYALLPMRASMSRVASAASAAFFTAARKSEGFAENASTNAASGSMSVRDGGRARVYVYSRSRAAETARDQSCTATTPADEAVSVWTRAEKKILVILDQYIATKASIKRTHEYNAPLVPPIFSAATSETAMRTPMTSSPLIEPARRRASTARSTIDTGA